MKTRTPTAPLPPYTHKNAAAVALGRMAAGIPKHITPAERALRRQRAARAREAKAAKAVLKQKQLATSSLNVENGVQP